MSNDDSIGDGFCIFGESLPMASAYFRWAQELGKT